MTTLKLISIETPNPNWAMTLRHEREISRSGLRELTIVQVASQIMEGILLSRLGVFHKATKSSTTSFSMNKAYIYFLEKLNYVKFDLFFRINH
jgi:hypothetical protein